MAEYTYKDIIIDPISEEAKNAIDEGCYFGSNPKTVLDFANCNEKKFLRVLECIKPEEDNPFYDYNYGFPCIIVKKEEPKPKYVPFESKEEFIEAFHYHDNANYSETEDILMNYGMWLKDFDVETDKPIYRLISKIEDSGIQIPEYGFFDWKDLFLNSGFEFLDGTPCGKEAEDE